MNTDTLVLRQIHPAFVQAGRVTSQAFRPTPKDQGRLSAYDSDQITAEASHVHYTTELGLTSVGVLAVTVGECAEVQLVVEADPEPFPPHIVVVFTELTESQCEKRSKKLSAKAADGGWLYQPVAP